MQKKTAKITIMNKSTRARSINQIFGIDESLFQTQKIRPTVKAKIFVNYNKTVYFAPNKSNGQNPSQLIFIPCINCGNDNKKIITKEYMDLLDYCREKYLNNN